MPRKEKQRAPMRDTNGPILGTATAMDTVYKETREIGLSDLGRAGVFSRDA